MRFSLTCFSLTFLLVGPVASLNFSSSLAVNQTLQLKDGTKPSIHIPESAVVKASDGTSYSLASLEPDVSLYSEKHFVTDPTRTHVADTRTGEEFPVSVFRASYDDGTIILAETDDEDNVVYVEIHQGPGIPTTFLQSADPDHPVELLSLTENAMDSDAISSHFHYGQDEELPDDVRRSLFGHLNFDSETRELSDYPSIRLENGAVRGCAFFKVVDVAIVFDSEWCALHGNSRKARRAIRMIVASASLYYETYMCVKLKLTGIFTPEPDVCRPSGGYFQTFNRDVPCGSDKDTFLKQFTVWARDFRVLRNMDPDATVHLFSGYRPNSGTVGCAWIGSTCIRPYSYGVEFLAGLSQHSQTIVFTHELGHNLNARHLANTNEFDYIMEPFLGQALDGFSQTSIQSVLEFLDRPTVTCDSTELLAPLPPIPASPSSAPSEAPSASPSSLPTEEPTSSPPSLSRGTSNDKECITQDSVQPVCALSSNKDRYACYDKITLLGTEVSEDCVGDPQSLQLLSCQDEELVPPKRSRELKKNVDDTLSAPLGDQPDKIVSDKCGEKCIEVDNYVCVLAETDMGTHRAYNVTYAVRTSSGGPSVFSGFVLIVNEEQNNGRDACNKVLTSCKKEKKNRVLRGAD